MSVDRPNAALYAGADQTIRLLVFSDIARTTRKDCSAYTVTVKIRDVSGVTTTYATTAVTAASGNYTLTLSSDFHNEGKGTIYLLLDNLPYDRPKVEMFVELP